jgi:hypothetical protein
MNKPRQLPLPFNRPPPRAAPVSLADVYDRLVRVEARLVQLMKHEGMTTDGRAPLPTNDQEK